MAALNTMRVLVIIVLISASLAEHKVHYPTDHPGVCNILAFVNDQVDAIAHMGKNETESIKEITDKVSQLTNEIQKVKRQLRDVMQVAQCPATDLEMKQQNATVETLDKTKYVAETRQVENIVINAGKLNEHDSSTSSFLKKRDKLQETSKGSRETLTEATATTLQLSQDSASTQSLPRSIRDVAHILETHLQSADSKENGSIVTSSAAKQENLSTTEYPTTSVISSYDAQHVALAQTATRPIRDVVHVLGSRRQTIDNSPLASQHVAKHESAGNVADLLPPSFDQSAAFAARFKRQLESQKTEEISEISDINLYIQMIKPSIISRRLRRSQDLSSLTVQPTTSNEMGDCIQEFEDPHKSHANDDSVIAIIHPRGTRSVTSPHKPKNPKDNQHTVGDEKHSSQADLYAANKGVVRSKSADISEAFDTTTHKDSLDFQEDFREQLKPTVKVHQLPITQFAHRSTLKNIHRTAEVAGHLDS